MKTEVREISKKMKKSNREKRLLVKPTKRYKFNNKKLAGNDTPEK